MTLQQLLPLLTLPVVFALVGSSVAKILSQDGFAPWANDLIAWSVLVLSAVLSAYAAHQLTGDPYQIAAVLVGTATLLVSGGLSSLKPWLIWLDFLQQYVFPVIKSREAAPAPLSEPTTQEQTK